MIKVKAFVVIVLLGLMFTGCASMNSRKVFATGAKQYADRIIPAYKAYVANDSTLEQDSKRIRIQTADEFTAYIDSGTK